MIQKDQNRLNMWKTVLRYLKANESVWKTNKPFAKAVAELEAAVAAAGTAIQGQTATSTGVTGDREALEAVAIEKVVAIAKSAYAYALDKGDNTLSAAVNFSKSTLQHLPEAELAGRLRSIVAAAQEVSDDLEDFGVDKSDYTPAMQAIADYEAAPVARNVIADKSVVTNSIPGIMKAGRLALIKMDNLAHVIDKASPQFSAGYRAVRIVVDAGGRHD